MSFDVSKLKELNELDFEQVAIWSKEVKIVVVAFVVIVVGALRYYYNIDSRAAIALSTHAQNVFPTVVGALRLDSAGFTNGYRALYTCTNLQTVVIKRIVHEEKCAEGAKKLSTRAKQSFPV